MINTKINEKGDLLRVPTSKKLDKTAQRKRKQAKELSSGGVPQPKSANMLMKLKVIQYKPKLVKATVPN